ncbi:MAG: nuclear transport factor 2 family protein [Pseudonocardiaceae bacterium]
MLETLSALAGGDYPRMLSNLSEDIRFYVIGSTPYSGLFVGRQALLDKVLLPMGRQRDAGGFAEEIINLIAEGDLVVTESRGRKTTVTGQQYNNEYLFIYRLQAGRITEWRCYLDTQLLADTHD